MKPIGRNIAASYKDQKLTLIRVRVDGPDAVIELSYDDMETLFDYWHTIRPKPAIETLQAILDAEPHWASATKS